MIDVFLVHRHRLLAETIAGSLSSGGDIRCVGSSCCCRRALKKLRFLAVDVVLVDANVGHCELSETIREIKEEFPDLNVLLMGIDAEKNILDLVEAGANGYVSTDASLTELVESVAAVSRGQTLCSPKVVASVLARIEELSGHRPSQHRRREVKLTPREGEVLRLVAAGLRNKEIAGRLGIRLPTVKNHVHKILDKFQAKQRREAIRLAYQDGLLDDPLPPSFSRQST